MKDFIKSLADAQIVKYVELAHSGNEGPILVAVWFGGIGVNVYQVHGGRYSEIDYWTVFNDFGKPLSDDEMEDRMIDYLNEQLELEESL